MIVSGICIVTLCFIIAMPNSKLFGKVNVFEMKEKSELPTKKDIEMTTNEGGDNKESIVTIPNGESSTSEAVVTEPTPVPTTSVLPVQPAETAPIQAVDVPAPVPAEN